MKCNYFEILLINTDEDIGSVIYYAEWNVYSHLHLFLFSKENNFF